MARPLQVKTSEKVSVKRIAGLTTIIVSGSAAIGLILTFITISQ